MSFEEQKSSDGVDRRGFLRCMTWAGAGVCRTLKSGILQSQVLVAQAGNPPGAGAISPSPRSATATSASPRRPTRTSPARSRRPSTASTRCPPARLLDPHRRPHPPLQARGVRHRRPDPQGRQGRPDVLRPRRARRLHRRRQGSTSTASARAPAGTGWYSFDHKGVHFVGLVNVANLGTGGRLGRAGRRAARLAEERPRRRWPTARPIVVFAHVPLWTVYPKWGWGTEDGAAGARTASSGSVRSPC